MSDKPKLSKPLRWAATGVGAVIGILIVLPVPWFDRRDVLVGSLLFVVALYAAAVILTTVHETAHAVVGRLLGWEVFGVTLGAGPRLIAFRLGSIRVELRGAVVGGMTIANATGTRWRDVAMLSAGIATEVLAISVMLVWSPAATWAHFTKWAIVVVASIDIAANLWPRRVDIGPLPGVLTDGAQLQQILATPDQWRSDLEYRRFTPQKARLVQALQRGTAGDAIDLARAQLAEDPSDAAAGQVLGTMLLLEERWREAFDQLAPLADRDGNFELANNTAWAAVMTFDPTLLSVAERLSERAVTKRPSEPACLSTRGSSLTMLGRHDEALTLLERALDGPVSRQQKASVLAFAALANHRLGRNEAARARLAESERLHPACPALPEIKRLILFEPPVAHERVG